MGALYALSWILPLAVFVSGALAWHALRHRPARRFDEPRLAVSVSTAVSLWHASLAWRQAQDVGVGGVWATLEEWLAWHCVQALSLLWLHLVIARGARWL